MTKILYHVQCLHYLLFMFVLVIIVIPIFPVYRGWINIPDSWNGHQNTSHDNNLTTEKKILLPELESTSLPSDHESGALPLNCPLFQNVPVQTTSPCGRPTIMIWEINDNCLIQIRFSLKSLASLWLQLLKRQVLLQTDQSSWSAWRQAAPRKWCAAARICRRPCAAATWTWVLATQTAVPIELWTVP